MKIKIRAEITAEIPETVLDSDAHAEITRQLINMLYVYDQPESNDYCDFKDMTIRSIHPL